MGVHNLHPAEGSTHRRKIVGRGIGSGHGKTSTRGHKGNKARGQVNPNFEGGQTPLHRRLPQLRGTASRNPRGFKAYHKTEYALINVDELEAQFDAGAEITPELLVSRGILRNLHDGLKILGNGSVTKQFTVRAHKFSQSAQEKLQAAGGTVEILAAERR
ncbi:MAG TPA: 50S ribosomal protein L15 [Chthonomonadaceae bacterium]|nr:50S ribosomal protein L15 [Chthonomonadaceae bacterium]